MPFPEAVLPRDNAEWGRLGDAVGQSTILTHCVLGHPGYWVPPTDEEEAMDVLIENRITITSGNISAFCEGFVNNRSIERLFIMNTRVFDFSVLFQMLGPFFENSSHLQLIRLIYVHPLCNDIANILIPHLSRSHSLTTLELLTEEEFTSPESAEIVWSLRELHFLKEISLRNLCLRTDSRTAVETLLLSHYCQLNRLHLENCIIGGGGMNGLLRGLRFNRTLKYLMIDGYFSAGVMELGLKEIAICLRLRNHTLVSLGIRTGQDIVWPGDLWFLLQLNRNTNKRFVSTVKSFYYNFICGRFDGRPLDEMDQNLLTGLTPHLLARIGGNGDDGRTEQYRHSAMYHFIRNRPLLVVAPFV